VSSATQNPHPRHPLIIGLTGGLGSGKSSAADRFAFHGVPVIDTDQIARELVQAGQPALQRIAAHFGPDILEADGALNRAALRERVFRDAEERRFLEALLHPLIRTASLERIHSLDTPYCIWVIPLLLETGARADVDRVLLIDSPEWLQLQRVQARDRLEDETIRQILAAQAGRAQRQAIADDIILNDGSQEALQQAVDERHGAYLALAAGRDRTG
jgi:dephospho-CoA kinase